MAAKKKRASTKAQADPALPSLALVFGYIAVKELQRLEDRVAVLSRLGFGNPEMATICGTSPATIATLKHKIAKRSARK